MSSSSFDFNADRVALSQTMNTGKDEIHTATDLYNNVASLISSWTARPSEAYSFFVLSFNRAFVAINAAMPVRKSTRSFSNSTRSDIVVSGSYLKARRQLRSTSEGNEQFHHPVEDISYKLEIWTTKVLHLRKMKSNIRLNYFDQSGTDRDQSRIAERSHDFDEICQHVELQDIHRFSLTHF